MVLSMEILENKFNFLSAITEELGRRSDVNFDFSTFVIENNLVCTDVVLIIKALTIMNYRRFNMLNEHINEFSDDSRLKNILIDSKPTLNEFKDFLIGVNLNLDVIKLLNSLKNEKIGVNICKFLLEDISNT